MVCRQKVDFAESAPNKSGVRARFIIAHGFQGAGAGPPQALLTTDPGMNVAMISQERRLNTKVEGKFRP